MKFHQKVGPITMQLCYLFNGWVFGEGADYLSIDDYDKIPSEINIVVPHDKWIPASKLLYGGEIDNNGRLRVKDGQFMVNVQMGDACELFYLYNNNVFTVYQPKHGVVIGKVN